MQTYLYYLGGGKNVKLCFFLPPVSWQFQLIPDGGGKEPVHHIADISRDTLSNVLSTPNLSITHILFICKPLELTIYYFPKHNKCLISNKLEANYKQNRQFSPLYYKNYGIIYHPIILKGVASEN